MTIMTMPPLLRSHREAPRVPPNVSPRLDAPARAARPVILHPYTLTPAIRGGETLE